VIAADAPTPAAPAKEGTEKKDRPAVVVDEIPMTPLTWTADVTKSETLRNGIMRYSTLWAANNWNWVMVGHINFGEPEYPEYVEWEWTEIPTNPVTFW
jgi:hypothetical protein